VKIGIVAEAVPPERRVLAVSAAPVRLGRKGRPYTARLVAKGGKAPYRWTRASGPVPRGLRLTAAGRLTGTPTARGRFTFVVRVTDAGRTSATRRVVLRIA
jgi:hypothetical protein